jgi:hypothetical protein
VKVPYAANQLFTQTGLTFSAWIKPTAVPDPTNMIMGMFLPYFNVLSTQRLNFAMWLSDASGSAPRGMKYANGATVVTLSEWHHVAATYDSNGYMYVYLDGKLDGTSGPYISTLALPNRDFYVGTWQSDLSHKFTGYIDEPRYYNHAIGVAEIEKIYAEGKSRHSLAEK